MYQCFLQCINQVFILYTTAFYVSESGPSQGYHCILESMASKVKQYKQQYNESMMQWLQLFMRSYNAL